MEDFKKQIVNEIHRPAYINFRRRKVDMIGIGDTYEVDLVEMIPHAKINRNFKYILTCIDIFSKLAFAIPIKNKSGLEVTKAMKTILSAGNVPRNIHLDKGKEFYNTHFRDLMKQYKINMYSTNSAKKASIIERFNRTLKNKMWKRFHYNGSYKWIDMLEDLISEYNNCKHRTIGMPPSQVNKNNEAEILHSKYMYKNELPLKPKYKTGDYVRISKFKGRFEKGYETNWTTEIFRIKSIQYTHPITYILEDHEHNIIQGAFYEPEIQRVKHPNIYLVEKILKRRGNSVYVKWLGFSDKYNEWIDKNDVL